MPRGFFDDPEGDVADEEVDDGVFVVTSTDELSNERHKHGGGHKRTYGSTSLLVCGFDFLVERSDFVRVVCEFSLCLRFPA